MRKRIKVLIADDHGVVREGLRMLISTEPDFEIVGEAKDGREALALARKRRPDVVIMDAVMPVSCGVKATHSLTRLLPKSRVLVLSASGDETLLHQMRAAGASGYLNKRSAPAHLLQTIRDVQEGNARFNPWPDNETPRDGRSCARADHPHALLTARETEVLKLVAEGFSSKMIAAELRISLATVRTHRQQLAIKLNVRGVANLTRYAILNRLTSPAHKPEAVEPANEDARHPGKITAL